MLQSESDPDLQMMQRCIALAKSSADDGEYPFAAVIASNGAFLCESANMVKRDHDVNSHAEIVAISKAQAIRGTHLSDCTIYATVEPCAQCSYAIREARIGRVVYGLRSPLMGGHSRWNILADPDLSTVLPEVFLPAPACAAAPSAAPSAAKLPEHRETHLRLRRGNSDSAPHARSRN